MSMDKYSRPSRRRWAQIERAFGKGSIMRLGGGYVVEVETISTGSLGLDIALGVVEAATGPGHRDLRAGIVGQDDTGASDHRRGPEVGRRLRLHRCRACPRSDLCAQARRQPRRSPGDFGPTTASRPSSRRHPDPLGLPLRAGHRFGGGTHPEGRTRGRDGREPSRHSRPVS